MSRRFIGGRAIAAALVLSGCAQPPATLYSWESFPRQQYDALMRAGASPQDQIRLMEADAQKARANNLPLPPGFRAHLGMLNLAVGNAGAAKELWLAEKLAFPESAPYMDSLVKRLESPSGAAKPAQENPA